MFADITDWVNFASPFRGWQDNTGQSCDTGESCEIFDFSLAPGDLELRNTTLDGVNQNGAFTPGSPCPAAVDGGEAITNVAASTSTFLLNAVEVVSDGVGNDDALCESNEICIYAPNSGSFQGTGDWFERGTCQFQNGTVSGVTMYGYY